jgi:hypothetical protein
MPASARPAPCAHTLGSIKRQGLPHSAAALGPPRPSPHPPPAGPCVLFATPGMLHGGTSLEVFKAWAGDARNAVLLPSHQVGRAQAAEVAGGLPGCAELREEGLGGWEGRCVGPAAAWLTPAAPLGAPTKQRQRRPRHVQVRLQVHGHTSQPRRQSRAPSHPRAGWRHPGRPHHVRPDQAGGGGQGHARGRQLQGVRCEGDGGGVGVGGGGRMIGDCRVAPSRAAGAARRPHLRRACAGLLGCWARALEGQGNERTTMQLGTPAAASQKAAAAATAIAAACSCGTWASPRTLTRAASWSWCSGWRRRLWCWCTGTRPRWSSWRVGSGAGGGGQAACGAARPACCWWRRQAGRRSAAGCRPGQRWRQQAPLQ